MTVNTEHSLRINDLQVDSKFFNDFADDFDESDMKQK